MHAVNVRLFDPAGSADLDPNLDKKNVSCVETTRRQGPPHVAKAAKKPKLSSTERTINFIARVPT